MKRKSSTSRVNTLNETSQSQEGAPVKDIHSQNKSINKFQKGNSSGSPVQNSDSEASSKSTPPQQSNQFISYGVETPPPSGTITNKRNNPFQLFNGENNGSSENNSICTPINERTTTDSTVDSLNNTSFFAGIEAMTQSFFSKIDSDTSTDSIKSYEQLRDIIKSKIKNKISQSKLSLRELKQQAAMKSGRRGRSQAGFFGNSSPEQLPPKTTNIKEEFQFVFKPLEGVSLDQDEILFDEDHLNGCLDPNLRCLQEVANKRSFCGNNLFSDLGGLKQTMMAIGRAQGKNISRSSLDKKLKDLRIEGGKNDIQNFTLCY